MKRKMKIPIALAFVLVLSLGLAACGGSSGTTAPTSGGDTTAKTQSDDAAATQPSPTPEPNDEAVQLSVTPIDTPSSSTTTAPSTSAGTQTSPVVGTQSSGSVPISLIICMNSDGEYIGGNSITNLILLYSGSNGPFNISDVTDLTMYVDGAATPISCNIDGNPTDWEGYAQYNLVMSKTFTQYPATYSLSCMYKGNLIEADETLTWNADQTFSYAPTREDMPTLEAPVNTDSPTPDTIQTAPDTSLAPDTSDQSEQSEDDIGINGTLFDLPEPFEAHDGDKQYFCIGDDERFSDDYIVTMETRDELYHLPGNPVTVYLAAFFDEEGNVISEGSFIKYVFETEAVAEEYCTIDTTFIPVGNVAYQGPMPEGVMRVGLQNPYKEAQITYANNTGATIYLSKP